MAKDENKGLDTGDDDFERQEDAFAQTYQRMIKDNAKIVAEYDKQYLKTTRERLEPVVGFEAIQDDIFSDTHRLKVDWQTEHCMRLRIAPKDATIKPSYARGHDIKPHSKVFVRKVGIEETPDVLVNIYWLDGKQPALQITDVAMHDSDGCRMVCNLSPDESSYGTGARTFGLNLRGREVSLWNTDPGAYQRTEEPINYCIPFYVGVRDDLVYGILWDNPARGTIDMGANDADKLVFEAERGFVDAYFMFGETLDNVLEQYTNLTGRMPMPPLWALGYHQSRYSYMTQDEMLAIAKEFRERKIACDALYLDIHYMQGYRVFTWNKKNFPDMAGMVDELHEMNFKLVPIVDPGVKVDPDYFGYQNGVYDDAFVKYPDGEIATGAVWPGLTHMPDFTSGSVRRWWSMQLGALLNTGIDGLWNDMNEPLFFGVDGIDYLPDYAKHDYEGHGAEHVEAHNVYGMNMARASRMALEAKRPDKRQFVITRAGYAGAQRYASSWTGDNRSSWDHLRLSLSMTLNMAISGQSFTGPDIGGFADDTTPELLARWTQAGALLPFYRNHSAVDTIYQEPWRFGEDVEYVCREAIQLRYDLMPYLYTVFAQNSRFGHPIIKPVWTTELSNHAMRGWDDSYLVGDNLLVAPVVEEGALRRLVYLPDGVWYDYWTLEHYEGKQFINVEAPLERLPLFVRAGTVLPTWYRLKHLDSVPKTTQLRIYAGDGASTLYQDAGDGFDYRNGQYRHHQFEMQRKQNETIVTLKTDGDWKDAGIFEIAYMGRYASLEVEGGDIEGQSQHEGAKVLRMRGFERLIFKDY
jgi:alpha-glucosidase